MEVIRDDMSSAGLRRVHLMDVREISLDVGLGQLGEGWDLVEFASYEDDLDLWHLHLYFRRQGMNVMLVCATYNGDHGAALGDAVERFERRLGYLPNVAYVNEGVNGAGQVEVRGKAGEVRGVVVVRRVSWMLPVDVGVTFEEVE